MIIVIIVAIILFIIILNKIKLKKLINIFNKASVCVEGLRGTGKDVLFGNIIARRKEPYISNLDYSEKEKYIKFDLDQINMNGNTYEEILKGEVKQYNFAEFAPRGTDIYISDAGVYFPSQFFSELNKKYKGIPLYLALSRQVSHNNVHINSQNLNRVWDKIREQSDQYILCRSCKFIKIPFTKKYLVNLKIRIYEKYESFINRMPPFRMKVPLFNKLAKTNIKLAKEQYNQQNGNIKTMNLFFINKSKHDTYYFEKLFENGKEV